MRQMILSRCMNDWMQKLKTRLPAIVLLLVTLVFWHFYDRYEAVGPALLQAPSLADASRMQGDCTEAHGRYILAVAPGGKAARINFRIPDGTHYERLRVRGRIKVDGVVAGKYPWRCARLLLVQYDENMKWIPGHHGVVSEEGTKDWTTCEDVFELDDRAAHVDLVIQQIGLEGVAEFDQLAAESVRLRYSYLWWRLAFAVSWLLMGVIYFRRCRLDSRRLRWLILLNALVIVMGTLMPGSWIEDSTSYAKEEAARLVESADRRQPPEQRPQKPAPPTKHEDETYNQFKDLVGDVHGAGHFVLFASLCFLVYLSAALEGQHRSYYFKVAFDILLFSSVTEALQYLTEDRTPGVSDWLIDVLGMAGAFLLFLVMMAIRPIGQRRSGAANP